MQTCKMQVSICDKQHLWRGCNEVDFFYSIWGPRLFTLLKRLEFGFPFSQEERILSIISQLIQSLVPVEWQLLDHFRCGRNDAQPWMKNLPAEMQHKERGIASLALRGWARAPWVMQSQGTRAAPCQLPQEHAGAHEVQRDILSFPSGFEYEAKRCSEMQSAYIPPCPCALYFLLAASWSPETCCQRKYWA